MSVASIGNLDNYLQTYGKVLGAETEKAMRPLHAPGEHEDVDTDQFLRPPFKPQAHLITSIVKGFDDKRNNLFIVGTMGTGKTLMGMCSIHAHAKGKPYVAVVMCPDHLIEKWAREIKETIPAAEVLTFDNWRSTMKYLDLRYTVARTIKGKAPEKPRLSEINEGDETVERYSVGSGKIVQRRAKWRQPLGPTWMVLGRNQSKWNPDWIPIGDDAAVSLCVSKTVVTGKEVARDENDAPIIGPDGVPVWKPTTQLAALCPKCGNLLRDKDGAPISPDEIQAKQATCKALYLRQISPEAPRLRKPNEELKHGSNKAQGLDVIRDRKALLRYMDNAKVGTTKKLNGKTYEWLECGEPLWRWTRRPYRWPPSKLIQKKLRGLVDYLIVDEVHEEKSAESAQSMAAGKLMAASKRMLALTGTLIGGYASHLMPLLIRMNPRRMVHDEGFKWGSELAFAQKYGRVDTIVTTKIGDGDDDDAPIVKRGQSGMGRSRGGTGKSTKRTRIAPGVMPTLFGAHLIETSVFLQLEDMDDSLPRLIDYEITSEEDVEFPGAGPQSVEMDEELASEYKRIETTLDLWNKELLKKGSMKLLGATLHTLMDYPDRPYGWEPKYQADPPDYPEPSMAVGYYEGKKKNRESWRDVVQPRDLPVELRAKEARLIRICKDAKKKGYQSWVYCQMTGKRDIQPRLKKLLEEAGLSVEILRSNTVPLRDRESWIYKVGKKADVIISHPQLVSTGLDLFAKDGNHNFNNIVFYETGYNLFTLRQAARRAWRIGQERDCMVHYLFFAGTMQERAMSLMGKKLQAAESIDGKFSTEGLIAMAGEENAQLALARSLSEKIEDQRRAWNRFGDEKRKAVVKALKNMKSVIAQAAKVDRILGEGKTAEAFAEAVKDELSGFQSEPVEILERAAEEELADILSLPIADEPIIDIDLGDDEAMTTLAESIGDLDLDALLSSEDEDALNEMLAAFASADIDLSSLV